MTPKDKLVDKDENGDEVSAGTNIAFCYGLPPVRVEGIVFERDGNLILPTKGDYPEESTLDEIR